MRNRLGATLAATAMTLAVSWGVSAFADGADPTVQQIYQAAESGKSRPTVNSPAQQGQRTSISSFSPRMMCDQ